MLAYGLLSWLLAAFVAYAGVVGSPPALADLLPVDGVVQDVTEEQYALKIGLVGDAREFVVAKKTGHVGQVEAAMLRSSGKRVTLWADLAHPGSPLWAPKKNVYQVFAVAAGDRIVMSWNEAAAGWRSDNRIALWLAPFFLLSGIFLLRSAMRMPR